MNDLDPKDQAFETLFLHAAFCTGQIRKAVALVVSKVKAWPSADKTWNRAVLDVLDNWGDTLAASLTQTPEGASTLVHGFPTEKPAGSVRDAAAFFERFTTAQASCLAATVSDGRTQCALLNCLTMEAFVDMEDEETDAVMPGLVQARDELIGLHCLMGGESPEEATASIEKLALELVKAQLSSVPLSATDAEKHLPRSTLAGAARDFDTLKQQRRLSVIDLQKADLNPDRAKFEDFVKARVAEAVAASSPDRYRDLWKSLLADADRRFSWQPADLPVRPISESPSKDPLVRHATRVIAMVHELHKAGYQRIRMLPHIAPSGAYWRCAITYADNVEDDGYSIRNFDTDNRLVAPYTTADKNHYFGWTDAEHLSARELAVRFLKEFPLIAERGQGRDWLYAGWVTDVLGRAEQGRQEDLLYLMADWDLEPEILRDWQPPPPIRT